MRKFIVTLHVDENRDFASGIRIGYGESVPQRDYELTVRGAVHEDLSLADIDVALDALRQRLVGDAE